MKLASILSLVMLFCASNVRAEAPINITKLALSGYDPVAYFVDSTAVMGSPEFTHEWMGATWWFSNSANKAEFASDPGKYAPRYGGYCAFGMSRGYKAKIDPEAWTILDGRLYLNYDAGVRERWKQDVERLIEKADKNWEEMQE